jgi:8-oxoguanine deaminase
MRQWIRHPLACLADGAGGGLVIENDRIAELVASGAEPAAPVATVFDASRHVVLPGLINAHHHMYQSLTRAHPKAINKELFPWLETLLGYWTRLTPEAHRLATRLTLVELLLSGCTTAADHHYLFAKGCEDAVDIQVDEARRIGMRMIVSRGSMDLSRRDGAMAPESVVQDRDTILADCERVISRYHEGGEGAMVQIALAPCTPFTASPELMAETATLARRHGCRLHTHLAETRDEVAYCESRFGCRPVDYLENVGWIGPDVWVAHGIHFNDAEIERLGRSKIGVCHCPTSNMVLASGQCRTRELEAAGVTLGLGVDGSASNDSSNLMESARHALLINRLTYDATVTHLDTLRWASEGSARCLGRPDIGAIAVGRQADLAFYTLDELRFSGAGDPIAALVLCGAHRADRVMVGGRWLIEDGAPAGVDLERLRHEHGAMAKRFLE